MELDQISPRRAMRYTSSAVLANVVDPLRVLQATRIRLSCPPPQGPQHSKTYREVVYFLESSYVLGGLGRAPGAVNNDTRISQRGQFPAKLSTLPIWPAARPGELFPCRWRVLQRCSWC
jgi:hypothetical protein